MSTTIIIILAFGLLLAAKIASATLFPSGSGKARAKPSAYRRADVMTANERDFHRRLLDAVPAGYDIWPQVAMLALVQPVSGENYARAKGQITNQRCDFVIAFEGEARLVIELDDATHDTKRDRDAERDRMLEACGYKTMRFESRHKPAIPALRSAIADVLLPREPARRRATRA